MRTTTLVALSCFVLFAFSSEHTAAATLQVPTQHATIQGAIQAAVPGDVVSVAPGTYAEVIDFLGKAITVSASGGPSQTFIEPPAGVDSTVVFFQTNETTASVLSGFTIRNGHGSPSPTFANCGGGILCLGSSPTITQNIIENNGPATPQTGLMGGGICCLDASPVITENTIRNNEATWGAGIAINNMSNPIVEENRFFDNDSWRGGGLYLEFTNATVHRNIFIGNFASFVGGSIGGGGGAYIAGGAPTLTHNTFFDNSANDMGGAVFCQGSAMTMTNCILWGNSSLNNTDFSAWDVMPTVTYSNIAGGYAGTGNINADPLFVDPLLRDVNLQQGSPCIDTGDPLSPPDPDLTQADMGALPFPQFGPLFTRGDCNADRVINLADVIFALNAMFIFGAPLEPCTEACDANDSGMFNVADPVHLLQYLFQSGPAPSSPFPDCGVPSPTGPGCAMDACP